MVLRLVSLAAAVGAAIDRRAVVSRHDVVMQAADSAALDTANDVLSVGNGAYAFNADVTGLQTFNESYTHLGLNQLSDWQFHTTPFNTTNPDYALRYYNFSYYDTPVDGAGATRRVPYVNAEGNPPDVVAWLMSNPHRLNLMQASLRLAAGPGATQPLSLASLANASQRLSLYEGLLDSNFTLSPPPPATCSLTPDNFVATFSCGDAPGALITGVPFASYGQPTGSCAAGFAPSPRCASANASAVLAALCVGRAQCSVLVNWQAGFGDPCPGKAKELAANVTCSAAESGGGGAPPPPWACGCAPWWTPTLTRSRPALSAPTPAPPAPSRCASLSLMATPAAQTGAVMRGTPRRCSPTAPMAPRCAARLTGTPTW